MTLATLGQILSWCKVASMKKLHYGYYVPWLHCSWRTHDGKRSQRSLHPVPCYLKQPHHTIPLVIWSSFIIKLVRLLLATHSSCWRLFQSFPPLLAANLLPAFKQNLLNGIHFSLLSECTILIQLGEEAEDSRTSLHFFCSTNLGKHSPDVGSPLNRWKVGLSFQFIPVLLFMRGMQIMSLQLLRFLSFHFSVFFKDHFLIGRGISSWWDLPQDN